jgi:hypothetical protein
LVTDGVIPILGVAPALGRSFTRKDAPPNRPGTVILMDGYWRRKAIGVMPSSFRFLDIDVSLIQPLQDISWISASKE